MVYLDNPERCCGGRPSDRTSANSYGFRPASTRFADPKTFAHVRQELGIDPGPETDAPHD
jgi:hypothetical protein